HPYIYTYAREAYDTGLPIMRPLLLEYPSDVETYELDDQFLFGEELLVAPVVEEGVTYRKVYLPKGNWLDYNNPKKNFKGRQSIDYDTPLEVIPMFVKEGAIIPKMPVMPYIGAMKNAPLILEIFPAAKPSEFTIYEDEGTNNDYRNDHFSKTKIESKTTSSEVIVTINEPQENNFSNKEKRNFWLEIFLEEEPSEVKLNGKKISENSDEALKNGWNSVFELSGYYYDAEDARLFVRL